MISSTKSQNLIVISMTVIGLICGASLVLNTSYYTGSYTISRYVTVSLQDIQIAHLDPSNETVNPGLSMIFNVKAPDNANGMMTLKDLSATVSLNEQPFLYATFKNYIPVSDQSVTAGYNMSFTLGSTVTDLLDKQILYNASLSDNWTFTVTLSMEYYLFQSGARSWRYLIFVYEGYTPV
jgi:hypothetical protein